MRTYRCMFNKNTHTISYKYRVFFQTNRFFFLFHSMTLLPHTMSFFIRCPERYLRIMPNLHSENSLFLLDKNCLIRRKKKHFHIQKGPLISHITPKKKIYSTNNLPTFELCLRISDDWKINKYSHTQENSIDDNGTFSHPIREYFRMNIWKPISISIIHLRIWSCWIIMLNFWGDDDGLCTVQCKRTSTTAQWNNLFSRTVSNPAHFECEQLVDVCEDFIVRLRMCYSTSSWDSNRNCCLVPVTECLVYPESCRPADPIQTL